MKSKRTKLAHNPNLWGHIFVAPFIIVFLVFSVYPIANTFWLSFTDAQFMNGLKGEFVGLKNYTDLWNDNYFMTSLKNTFALWMANFIPQLCGALFIAVMMTSVRLKLRFNGLWKTGFFLPNILMPVAVASLFATFFSNYGVVNQFLASLGIIEENIIFMNKTLVVKGIVIFINWWMWFGQTVIILMAGMTAISPSYYESALVDGASQFKMFWHITLPLLKPILVYTLVTSLVGGLQMFDIPFLLTDGRGSPGNSILTMNILMNLKRTSMDGDIGPAAAVSIMIFIISSILAFVIMKTLGEKEEK